MRPLISNFTFTRISWCKWRRKLQIYGNTKLAIMPSLPTLYVGKKLECVNLCWIEISNLQYLPPASASTGWGKVPFSVCLSVLTRGNPHLPMGGVPQPGHYGIPHQARQGVPLWAGLDRVPFPSRTVWVYPPPPAGLDGAPPPLGDRAAQRGLATQWEVYLLRSCRRTFLLSTIINHFGMSKQTSQ